MDNPFNDMAHVDIDMEDPEWSAGGLPSNVKCSRCGSRDVYWQEIVNGDGTQGWALFDDSNHRRHLCQSAPSADGFVNEEEKNDD